MISQPPSLHRRFPRRFNPYLRVILAVLGIVVGVAIAWLLSRAADRAGRLMVLSPTDPEPPLAAGADVQVEFNRPLDPQGYRDYFQVEPPIQGEWELEGANVIFNPSTALPYGARLSVLVSAGLSGLDGTRLQADVAVEFQVRQPLLLYLKQNGLTLQAESLDGHLETLLTSPEEILDTAVSPDGQWIAYSVVNGNGGQDLRLLDRETLQSELLVDCHDQVCGDVAWSPDGERLAFSRREPGQDLNHLSPRIWTVSVAGKVAAPLYQDERILGRDPVWSPDGLGLAFYDPGVQAVRLLDLDTVQEQIIPSGLVGTGSWSPDSGSFVLARQQFGDDMVTADLVIVDTVTRRARVLTDPTDGWSDISHPRWSPDGDWIAFAGQSASTGQAKGLFLIRPDDGDLRQVESQPGVSHGAYSWDPLGSMLLFQQFDLGAPQAVPVVAVWQRDIGGVREIASDAYAPAWLP